MHWADQQLQFSEEDLPHTYTLPSSGSSLSSGAVPTGYLDALPATASSAPSGLGMTSYLDTMGGVARVAVPSAVASKSVAPAAPVSAALASAAAALIANATPHIGNNFSTLDTGAEVTSYLDEISGADQEPALVTALEEAVLSAPSTSSSSAGDYQGALGGLATATSGGGLTSYLDTLPSSGSSLSSGAVPTGYLDALLATASSA